MPSGGTEGVAEWPREHQVVSECVNSEGGGPTINEAILNRSVLKIVSPKFSLLEYLN